MPINMLSYYPYLLCIYWVDCSTKRMHFFSNFFSIVFRLGVLLSVNLPSSSSLDIVLDLYRRYILEDNQPNYFSIPRRSRICLNDTVTATNLDFNYFSISVNCIIIWVYFTINILLPLTNNSTDSDENKVKKKGNPRVAVVGHQPVHAI